MENRTTFEYDAKGNLTAITDPENNRTPEPSNRLSTTFTYNEFGQPLTVTDPLEHTTRFEYDSASNLTATIDPLGHRTTQSYDSISRLIATEGPPRADHALRLRSPGSRGRHH